MTRDANDPYGGLDRSELPTAGLEGLPSAGGQSRVLGGVDSQIEGPGDRIGPFHLLSVLGEGGFGIVYLAERRDPITQRVALKVIKPGMDTKAVVARFEQERQALAVMDHPGVAKVIDAGATPTGRPYFAMEFVQGEPITEYCDRNVLGTRERLQLFMGVCDAIQHAHMRGIIHRDLKPSNVLVTTTGGKPFAKVIDFGIAKAISHTISAQSIFTEHGQFIGTPEYMSPEQAEARVGDIDTRTDVYSLGVLLYELLVGRLPFEPATLRSAGYAEIQRIIREVDPPRPSTKLSQIGEAATELARRRRLDPEGLRRELHRELEWIPLKAMRKDRAQRYRSPEELGDDVRNYLDGKPLIAGPESTSYRLSKFVRRHRATAFAGAAVALACVAGLSGIGVGYVRTSQALTREQEAKKKAEEQRSVADATREFLQKMLKSVDPEKSNGEEVTVRAMLDAAAKMVGESLKDDPVSQASVRSTIGQMYNQLGQFQAAEEQLMLALATDEKLLGADDKETMTVKHNLASAKLELDKVAEGRAILDEVYKARSRVLGANSEDALSSLSMLGFSMQLAGEHEAALKIYRQAHEAQKLVLGGKARETLQTLASIADVLQKMGKLEDAEKAASDLVRDAVIAEGTEGRMTLMGQSIRAAILRDMSKFDESERVSRTVWEAKKRIFGAEHPESVTTENILALTLEQLKRYDEAKALLTHAATTSELSVGPDHDRTLTYLSNLARVEQLRGDLAAAEPLMRKMLAARERVSGPDDMATLSVMNNLGLLLLDLKKPAEAETTFRAMLAGVDKVMPEDHWIRGQARVNVGECLYDQKKYEEAEGFMLAGYEQLTKVLQPGHSRIKGARVSLAKLYKATGNTAKAEEFSK